MTQSNVTEKAVQDPLAVSADQGRVAWQRLGLRLRAITPSQIVRFGLAAGVIAAVGWLAWTAWLSLLPFILGGVLAYIMLPIVNQLDRFMPRWFASLLTMGTVTAVFVYALAQVIPLIAQQVYNVAVTIPTEQEITTYTEELSHVVETLPTPAQSIVNEWLDKSAGSIRGQIDSFAERGFDMVVESVVGLFNALGFILGFLVIPTWLLTVLNEQKRGTAALNRMMPAAMKPDFWAVVRMTDRTMSTFVRGQFFIGLIVGCLTYLGLSIIVRLVNLGGDYNLVLALFSGIMALIPVLGPLLGSLPVILLGASISQETAVAATIMYVLIWLFVNNAITPHIEERLIDIHPAIMVIIIVAVSELGFIWVLLAAPLAGILRDLFRYTYGRFADPPRPAGILPYEPLPPKTTSTQPQPVPIAYRRSRARRHTTT
ncbi:MAG: AI-2E family transporter [Anaerolineae bacterium]|nr:AI-2E family transporter [Anaerolineae bacterium]